MNPRRKVLGEKLFKIAEQRARLRIDFEALGLPLAAMRKALQSIQALCDCHPMLVGKRRCRHLARLPADMSFSTNTPARAQVRSRSERRQVRTTSPALQ